MVKEAVEEDLLENSYVATTDDFLQSLLPMPLQNVDQLYTTLVNSKAYDKSKGLWCGLPVDKSKEEAFYEPFVAAASAINKACKELNGLPVKVWSSWIDRHSISPDSRDDDAPTIRPDILAVLGTEEEHQEWENEVKLRLDPTPGSETPNAVKTKKAKALTRAHWLRVHVPVEIKRDNDDIAPAVNQLCTYMRQIFREQVDRRFVFGLVFCKTDLSVWLCDRSGLLGTQTPFNIHKEPKKFIQVIAALALLDPERLGWDTSMRLYWPSGSSSTPFLHSYDRSVQLKHFHDTIYQTHWAIDMPSSDGSHRETFISVHGLSMARSEVMYGRATIVWEVVKYNDKDRDLNGNQRYVLKQCWRPMTSHMEAAFYERLPSVHDNIGKVYSSEDVMIEDVPDTTSRIRHELATTPFSIAVRIQKLGKKDRDETMESSLYVQSTSGAAAQFMPSSGAQATPRVLSRLLMETYGWPVKFFLDIPELLHVFCDAIQGHRYLYYSARVLHRDISVGNILICPEDNGGRNTRGRIIDLDYAKPADKCIDPVPFTPPEDWDTCLKNRYQLVTAFLHDGNFPAIDETVFFALGNRFNGTLEDIIRFVKKTVRSKDYLKNIGRSLTCNDLDIYTETEPRPDFSDHVPQVATRMATLPFASYEILRNVHYYPDTEGSVTHDSIHDLESFFWVLLYLCLTRSGPGGSRRDELKVDNFGGAPASLERIVYCFFDSDDMTLLAHNRMVLFDNEEEMESIIVVQFHPYFDSLKPLMIEWWRLLRISYLCPPVPTIYHQVIALIEKTIEKIGSTAPSTWNAASAAELERRKNDLARARQFGLGAMQSNPTQSAAAESASVDWSSFSPGRTNSSDKEYNAHPPQSPTGSQPSKKKPKLEM